MPEGEHARRDVPKDHLLANRTYDILKFSAQIVLPALGTLYFALAEIWGLPYADQVVGTIVAVDAFLGVLLSISTRSYDRSDAKYDGVLNVEEKPDGGKVLDLNLLHVEDPEAVADQKELRFRVDKPLQ